MYVINSANTHAPEINARKTKTENRKTEKQLPKSEVGLGGFFLTAQTCAQLFVVFLSLARLVFICILCLLKVSMSSDTLSSRGLSSFNLSIRPYSSGQMCVCVVLIKTDLQWWCNIISMVCR